MKMEYSITSLLLMTALISFLGFSLENIWLLIRKGYIDNRNMTLPFLLGYGMIVVGLYLVMGTPETITLMGHNQSVVQKYIVYYLISFILVSVGEIILGTFVEKVFGFEYWNYLRIPLHFTKYTSVPTSTGFAFIITLFMGKIFPNIMDGLMRIPENIAQPIAVILSSALIADFIVSFVKMYRNHSLNERWRKQLPDSFMIHKKSDEYSFESK